MVEQEYTVTGRVSEKFKVTLPEGIQEHEIEEYVEWAYDQDVGELLGFEYEVTSITIK